MIDLTEAAQRHFSRLLAEQGDDFAGVRITAVRGGTPAGDVKLEFVEPGETDDALAIDFAGLTVYVDSGSTPFLEDARLDFVESPTGGELSIKAPRLRGEKPAADAPLIERVRHMLEAEVAPGLASHGGQVRLESIDADGVAILRFGGGCQGCGMAEVTLYDGIEKTLKERFPGEITGVGDATEHDKGETPYFAR